MARSGNSRQDPLLIAAADETERLLEEAAEAADLAFEEYDLAPRWCGIPGPDYGRSHSLYPYDYVLLRAVDGSAAIRNPADWVVDEKTGAEYHRTVIKRLASLLKRHLPRSYEIRDGRGEETPRAFLDRIRGVLRWEFRLDSSSLVTNTLALLRCVRKGKKRRQGSTSGVPSYYQDYDYAPLPESDILMFPAAIGLAESIKRVFQHVDRALLPRNPSARELEFLCWMRDRGGECRLRDVIKWINADPSRGNSNNGQGPEAKLLRNFCEKDAPRGARRVWRLREAALELIP